MQQKRRRDALEGEIHLLNAGAADREFAAEIVAGGDARQRLNRAHRIVRHAAELLKLGAAELLLGRHCRIVARRGAADDGDRFGIRARSLGEGDRHLGRAAGRDHDRPLHQDEIDG